jgi:phytanoyl-CoA hydroxylase
VEPRRHLLNDSFEWAQPSGPFRRLTADQADQWKDVGAFVLEDVLEAAAVKAVIEAIDPIEDEITELLRTQPGGRVFIADAEAITFTTHMVVKSPVAKAFATQAALVELAADLIGDDVRFYWDQAVYKKPEPAREFPWHQDNGYNFIEPQQYLTCWIPLTDATVENGCPWVVPGMHRLGTLEHWWTDEGWRCLEDAPDAIPVEVKAGSVVVFSSLTPHRTGPNLSNAVRKAYIVQFAPEGAESVRRQEDGELVRTLHNDPERQFFVVRGGQLVV